MAAATTSHGAPAVVTVTPTVAQVLKRVGLSRKLYRVIGTAGQLPSPRVEWDAALSFVAPLGRRAVGDVIEFRIPGQGKKTGQVELARVEELSDKGNSLHVRVVLRATDVLGPCARQNELYLTSESAQSLGRGMVLSSCASAARTLDITDLHVVNLVEPASFLLRRTHDELIGPYWVSINKRAAAATPPTVHQHDFVYLMPDKPPDVFRICQVTSLKHKDDRLIARLQPFISDDSHRLRPQGAAFTCTNLHRDMVRKCTVIVTDHMAPPKTVVTAFVDIFWAQRGDVSGSCQACEEEREQQRKKAAETPSLKVLDLCAGAGGLSIGLYLASGQRSRIKSEQEARAIIPLIFC